MPMAQLCHRIGTTLPCLWHDCAKAMARIGHNSTVSATPQSRQIKAARQQNDQAAKIILILYRTHS